MTKVFVSIPMNGKTVEEIRAAQMECVEKYKNTHYIPDGEVELIDSIAPEHEAENRSVWCLGWSLQKMADADVVLFADGWKDARGCCIEHDVVEEYGRFLDEGTVKDGTR